MNNTICHLEIMTHDLEKAKKFYGDLFNWKFSQYGDTYALFDTGQPPGGGIEQKESFTPGNSVIFYIYVDDIPKTLAKVRILKGVEVQPKSEIPNIGYYALFKDLDGNLIGLYSKA